MTTSATSCPICGSQMIGDQTDRIVEFMRPHLVAERKAAVERILDLIQGEPSFIYKPTLMKHILDAEELDKPV